MSKLITTWGEIRSHYEWLEIFPSMLTLVKEIEASRHAAGLFAWTSMHDLCIVQTPATYPYDGPFLRISPSTNGQLEFRYFDTYFKEKQWSRVVEGSEGFKRLEHFIDQLHWF